MTITLVTDERSHQEVALLLSGVSFYGTSQCCSHNPSSISVSPFASDGAFLCVYFPPNFFSSCFIRHNLMTFIPLSCVEAMRVCLSPALFLVYPSRPQLKSQL